MKWTSKRNRPQRQRAVETAISKRLATASDDDFIVTIAWINANATRRGAYTRKQLEILGVAWPPVQGWKYLVDGTPITQEERATFEEIAWRPATQITATEFARLWYKEMGDKP